ncbi:MAG: hypothetical protein IJ640_10165 [Prevotella sp.]|nr:hypothetical protein [Prevotella sp.]
MEKIEFWDTKGQPKVSSDPALRESDHHRPQDDIPTEVIIHYIVKDYRRMFNKAQQFEPSLKNKQDKIRELVHQLRKRQVAALTDEQVKKLLQNLTNKVEKQEEELTQLRQENEQLKAENDKFDARLEEVRSSRNSVIEAVTDDLQQKLDEANQRIKLLAQAVVDPEKADSVFLQQCTVHTIETDDDRKWMAGATKQLEKAAMQLLSVADRLTNVEEALKGIDGIDIAKVLKNHGKALSRLTAVISHIECFFDKVGDIQFTDDETEG